MECKRGRLFEIGSIRDIFPRSVAADGKERIASDDMTGHEDGIIHELQVTASTIPRHTLFSVLFVLIYVRLFTSIIWTEVRGFPARRQRIYAVRSEIP